MFNIIFPPSLCYNHITDNFQGSHYTCRQTWYKGAMHFNWGKIIHQWCIIKDFIWLMRIVSQYAIFHELWWAVHFICPLLRGGRLIRTWWVAAWRLSFYHVTEGLLILSSWTISPLCWLKNTWNSHAAANRGESAGLRVGDSLIVSFFIQFVVYTPFVPCPHLFVTHS